MRLIFLLSLDNSLFGDKVKAHLLKGWILLEYCHGNGVRCGKVKVELHTSWWIPKEVSFVLQDREGYKTKEDTSITPPT